jgi:6-phosphogluconate dehydrogenase
MGQNLALNIADHGFRISVYNRTTERWRSSSRRTPTRPAGWSAAPRSRSSSPRSSARKIIILVKAGKPTDAVIDACAAAREGRHHHRRRQRQVDRHHPPREGPQAAKGLRFIGSGVSGGEEGARFGPSLMPGGDPKPTRRSKPVWNAIAAKVDAEDRQAPRPAPPGKPIEGGVPCCHLHRPRRRRPLRQDGPQRHRVRRHADDLRGLRLMRTCSA